ncbi:MAG: GntR family transcriptional regulator [Anaerolineales bacterium]|nr:GntR family transcriptional regulator [Anaerolineales bacterium]
MSEQIASGQWPAHYKLKPEPDLARDLGVNRGTLRKAIAELIDSGDLVAIHGRGTFVTQRKTIDQTLTESLIAFSEDLLLQGIQFETRVRQQAVIQPEARIASLLGLTTSQNVFFLERVRLVAGTPLSYLKNYVAHQSCQGIERVDFTQHRLFETLEGVYTLALAWGHRTFQAQVADMALSQLLEVDPGAPVMYMNQITYLRDDHPVEVSDVWFRGDRLGLSAIVKRQGVKTKLDDRLPPVFSVSSV